MNGKSLQIVDKGRQKEINRKVTRQVFNKKKEVWPLPPAYLEFARLTGKLLFIPIALIIGILEGIKEGFISGLKKALSIYGG